MFVRHTERSLRGKRSGEVLSQRRATHETGPGRLPTRTGAATGPGDRHRRGRSETLQVHLESVAGLFGHFLPSTQCHRLNDDDQLFGNFMSLEVSHVGVFCLYKNCVVNSLGDFDTNY